MKKYFFHDKSFDRFRVWVDFEIFINWKKIFIGEFVTAKFQNRLISKMSNKIISWFNIKPARISENLLRHE